MIRLVTLVAVAAALTTPALAQELKVSLVGKTPEQVDKAISRAADRLCRDALRGSVGAFAAQVDCVAETKANAYARLPAEFASRSTPVASK